MATATWHHVCSLSDLEQDWAEAALIEGQQIALVRTVRDEVFAFAHEDPNSGALVMARGIVGRTGDHDSITSPLYKETYDLRTGECLTGQDFTLPIYPVQIAADGAVSIQA